MHDEKRLGSRWSGHVARMGKKRNACRVLVGKPEERKPGGRHRRKRKVMVKSMENVWTGFSWLRLGVSGRLL